MRLAGMEFRHGERLVEAFSAFRGGRQRLILAFRHPYGDEPQLLSYALDSRLAREARRLGAPLGARPHARFVHGYEVPLWSGPLVRWLLPRVGALPVYHVRFDAAGVERIRAVLRDGDHPLALAPEGQVSYRSETLPRIEKGAVRLGFWCAEDLAKAGRTEGVAILPISVHYRYDEAEIGRLERMVASLERSCGLRPPAARAARIAGPARKAALVARLAALEAAILGIAEARYGLPPVGEADGDGAALGAAARDLRMDRLLETALARGEAALGIVPERGADRIARVYRIRQEGWDRVYPTANLGAMCELKRALADLRAGEAWHAMRHMELVDLAHYLDSSYLRPGEDGDVPFGRVVETAYSLADLASRLAGGDISDRPNVLRKRAVLVIAPKIDLAARLGDYRADRKAAVEAATRELEAAYLSCIEEYINERRD